MPHKPAPQRILCAAFTDLETDRIARMKWGKSWLSAARPDGPPLAVTAMRKNAIRIIAHDGAAHDRGIFAGQPLGDARALVPDIECHEQDAAASAALLHGVALWCARYTPLVALDSAHDGLFLDITGCAHLFGGEAAMLAGLASQLKAQGFHARLCLADTPGAAFAMARFGSERLIAPGAHREAVLPLPMAALRLEPGVVAGLDRVGLKTIGCIANLPRAPLAARFGAHLLQRLDQALGREDEAISPLMPVAELTAEKRLADPVVHEDDIRAIIAALAAAMALPLERRGLGLRECCLRLYRVDGHVASLSVQASTPLRDPARVTRLFRERLAGLHDDLDAGFGFDVIRLEVTRAQEFDAGQGDLAGNERPGEGHGALVDRLSARLGAPCVRQFVEADTHLPERSFSTLPVMQAGVARAMGGREPDALAPDAPSPTRPLMLLERPEPVETMAQVPDGPPLRFRWRRVLYEVARAQGPERIACEWWRDGRGAFSRDYFKVEDASGYRFWVFRHGLYGRETRDPKWYLHGIFA